MYLCLFMTALVGDDIFDFADIVERVLDTETPPFRPTMGDGCECPSFWLETMNSCWDECPTSRPTFAKLSHILHEHTDGRYGKYQPVSTFQLGCPRALIVLPVSVQQ